MKMSKVAKMIGVDRRTIYNWVTHEALSHLFSEGARNEGNRELDEQDIFVVNTINHLRQNVTTDWEEIADKIKEGYQVTDLSIGAADVDTGKTQLQQFTRSLAIAQERDAALKKLEEAQKELREIEDRYETKLDQLREQYEARLEEERKRAREDVEQERTRSQEQLEQERTRSQDQLEQERMRVQEQLEQERTRSQEQFERLLREIAELRYKMGQLEQKQDDKKE